MKIYFLLIFFFFISTFSAFCWDGVVKDTPVSSLEEDSNTVNKLHDLFWDRYFNDPEHSLEAAQQSFQIAQNIHYRSGETRALGCLGFYYLHKGNYQESLKNLFQGLSISKEINSSNGTAFCLRYIAKNYHEQGDMANALEYYLEAVKSYQKATPYEAAWGQIDFGLVYYEMGDLKRAMKALSQSLQYFQDNNNQLGTSFCLINIGRVYDALGNNQEAIKFYIKSLKNFKELHNTYGISQSVKCIGESYHTLGLYEKALDYYFESLKYKEQLKLTPDIADVTNLIAISYKENKQPQKAMPFALRSLKISKGIDSKNRIKSACLTLATLHASLNNFEKAYEYHRLYSDLKDSLLDEGKSRQITRLKVLHDIENKKKENELLKIENSLKASEIETQKKEERNLIISIIMLVVIALLIFWAFFQKRKINQTLLLQNTLIQQQNKELLDLNQEKNSLISIVSHDLKSPLRRVAGLSQLLRMEANNLTNDQKEYLQKIDKVISDGFETIQKILDISSIEEHKFHLKLEKLNVRSIIKNLIEAYQTAVTKKNINIILEEGSGEAFVTADQNYLIRICDNLISNAIKFSPFNKTIRIRIKDNKEKIIIEIEDEGPGITASDKPKLFQKYQKLTARPTAGENSTGLGLSIVKKLLEELKGNIRHENAPGQGSLFIVELPK